MKEIRGNKIIEISEIDISCYKKAILDLGTGDGRFVFENAKKNPDTLYVGVDPSQKQLEIYSKKAVKNRKNNARFILGSIEMLPDELNGKFDEVFITLPWGTLLKTLVNPTQENVEKIKYLFKPNSADTLLQIIFGYAPDLEPSETIRLNMPGINEFYIKENIIPSFFKVGFECLEVHKMDKNDLTNIETTWGKRLRFGEDRTFYRLRFSL